MGCYGPTLCRGCNFCRPSMIDLAKCWPPAPAEEKPDLLDLTNKLKFELENPKPGSTRWHKSLKSLTNEIGNFFKGVP